MSDKRIKAENTELRQEVARLDEALAIEKRRSADLASEKADDRVQYSKLRDVCRAQEDEIARLTAELRTASDMNGVYECRLQEKEAENERLRTALKPFAHLYLWPFDHHLAEEIMADADWCEEENDVTEEELFIRRKYIRAARAALSGDKQ